MKKNLFFILLFTLSIHVYSQIEKGTILLGGNGNISYYSDIEDFYIVISPKISYFITDHITLGVDIPFFTNFENVLWGFSPSVRYYFSSKSNKSLFVSSAVALADIFSNNNTLNLDPIILGIGYVWFLNKSIGIETEFTYGTDFEIFDVNLMIGFQIYLNNKNDYPKT